MHVTDLHYAFIVKKMCLKCVFILNVPKRIFHKVLLYSCIIIPYISLALLIAEILRLHAEIDMRIILGRERHEI